MPEPSPAYDGAPIDPGRCPLCGQSNACGAEAARCSGEPCTDCWCMTTPVPAALRAQVPAQAQGLACICRDCIDKVTAVGAHR
ncbi:cysteine-rich CWC family protein [uncultured Pseudacidovorax sp.]|uniref:cysteine-rich CWC family protein n=1 Tax=uncultured Pseudacidovorax sp. TaxID=679313 RepID=UPI0025D2D131|nr:cysteine-rich CWC family protein [uncultured Pseudacidovorax sp.]